MLLYLLAFVGGILTIISPCILPVLPFVFSRADQPFRRSGLPLLVGMALTFALVAAVATFAGAWIVRANQIGRILAMVIFGVLGLCVPNITSPARENPHEHPPHRMDCRAQPRLSRR
jgi:cytochrome c biogenesis protein CcdA